MNSVDELTKDVPASFIDIKPPPAEPVKPGVLGPASVDYWYKVSAEFVDRYKTGRLIGSYGKPGPAPDTFLTKLGQGITESIKAEYSRKSKGSEDLAQALSILHNTLIMIGSIMKKDGDIDPDCGRALAAILHGVLEEYINKTTTENKNANH